MEDTVSARPSVCFEVQKIIGVSIGNGNMKNYQVQWAPSWVNGFHLVGCERLIGEFLQQQSGKCQSVDDTTTTTGVKDMDDLVADTREDVSRDDNVSQFTFKRRSQKDIHDQASMVVNSFSENQESNTCSYLSTSNDNVNVSNEELCTNDIDVTNQTNTNFECIKVEDIDDNEDTQEDNAHPLPFMYKNPHLVNDDASGSASVEGQHGTPNLIQDFQNNVLVIERKEIMLEERSEVDQGSLNNNYENSSNSTENTLLHAGEMPWLLKRHVLLRTSQKPYQCNVCNKLFPQKDSLEKHLRLHVANKHYNSIECNKSFKKKSNSIDHFRLHTGDKPFKCTDCNKSFSHKHHLSRHFRLHTGEKPYKCSQCNKAFSDQSNLKTHFHSCKNK